MTTEAKCPVMHGSVTNAAAPTNSGWWPNQLSLKILHQNSSLSNPMGPAFEYAEAFKKLDYQALKKDLHALISFSHVPGRRAKSVGERMSSESWEYIGAMKKPTRPMSW